MPLVWGAHLAPCRVGELFKSLKGAVKKNKNYSKNVHAIFLDVIFSRLNPNGGVEMF